MEEQVVDFDLTPYMTPHYNEEESLVSQFEKLLQRISAIVEGESEDENS